MMQRFCLVIYRAKAKMFKIKDHYAEMMKRLSIGQDILALEAIDEAIVVFCQRSSSTSRKFLRTR